MITAVYLVLQTQLSQPKIVSDIDDSFFPAYWQTEEIKPKAVKIDEREKERSVAAIKKALPKYPNDFLSRNLKTVYIAKSIAFYGLEYGGTNSLDAIYLANSGARNGFTDTYLEEAFHHELSSILLRNYAKIFPTSEWVAALPSGFKYRGDGTQSLREGTANTTHSAKYHEKGFICEYSTSSEEEDLNMFAQALFTGDRVFWTAYDKYPALAKKADLVILFYNRMNSTFTKQKFRDFAQAPTSSSGTIPQRR